MSVLIGGDHMTFAAMGVCIVGVFVVFFVFVRNANRKRPYANELCELYLLNHMMTDGHPLRFMYHGLPRTRAYPRLVWPCVAVFENLLISVSVVICATVFGTKGMLSDNTIDMALGFGHLGGMVVTTTITMLIPTIQNHQSFRKMGKMDFYEVISIEKQIEQKWPGFFGNTK